MNVIIDFLEKFTSYSKELFELLAMSYLNHQQWFMDLVHQWLKNTNDLEKITHFVYKYMDFFHIKFAEIADILIQSACSNELMLSLVKNKNIATDQADLEKYVEHYLMSINSKAICVGFIEEIIERANDSMQLVLTLEKIYLQDINSIFKSTSRSYSYQWHNRPCSSAWDTLLDKAQHKVLKLLSDYFPPEQILIPPVIDEFMQSRKSTIKFLFFSKNQPVLIQNAYKKLYIRNPGPVEHPMPGFVSAPSSS